MYRYIRHARPIGNNRQARYLMRHYSCDVCGRDIKAGEDDHFVVRMQAYLSADSHQLTESDLEITDIDSDDESDSFLPQTTHDSLEELDEMLKQADMTEPAPTFREYRYDLCPSCHKKFLADPLGRESIKLHFSKN
jgi:hypothetical protein